MMIDELMRWFGTRVIDFYNCFASGS